MPINAEGSNGQLNKGEAEDMALRMQNILYQAPGPHLRSSKGYPREKYEETFKVTNELSKISKLIENLPRKQPERGLALYSYVERFGIDVVILSYTALSYNDFPKSEGFKKFSNSSHQIFVESEKFFSPNNRHEHGKNVFHPPVQFYMPIAYQIYERLSGSKYKSSGELKEQMTATLKGLKVLELAPGPGWFLLDLKAMGAEVYGLDKQIAMPELANRFGLQIKQGDAQDIGSHFTEKFDLIISNNFLNKACLNKDEAENVIRSIKGALSPNGISVNATQEFKIPKELYAIRKYKMVLSAIDAAETNKSKAKFVALAQLHDSLLAENSATKLLTLDEPVLSPNELQEQGLRKLKTRTENGYHVFSFEADKK